ncbi:MAG TPA: KH domain-containing protein [Acidimicrobiia bacterium]
MSNEAPDFDEGIEDDDFEDEVAAPGNRIDEGDVVDEVGADGNRILGGRARAVVEHVTRALADEPDMIEVDLQEKGRDEVFLLVHASPSDMGRLIGRRGRVIQAIRQVTRAAGAMEGVKAGVDVAE